MSIGSETLQNLVYERALVLEVGHDTNGINSRVQIERIINLFSLFSEYERRFKYTGLHVRFSDRRFDQFPIN